MSRSALRNTASSYGWISIAFHWLMALGIFGMFGLGLYMVELNYYDAWYRGSLDLHKSAGIMLAFVWLLRVLWRLMNPEPQTLGNKVWEHNAAHLTHRLLYLLMLAQFISGYLISTADGRAIEVFKLFALPATLTLSNQEDIAGVMHWGFGWALMVLVMLHTLAAIKHHWRDKDKTLLRMLKPGA
jgi:cytochrome b561